MKAKNKYNGVFVVLKKTTTNNLVKLDKLDSATIFFKNKSKMKIVCDKKKAFTTNTPRVNCKAFIEKIENEENDT